MRLISNLTLRRMTQAAYKKGLEVGDRCGYQRRKTEEGKPVIMQGYDMDKDLQEILSKNNW